MNKWHSPNALRSISQVAWTRVTQTKYTCSYVILILTSAVIGLILQGLIADLHSQALASLLDLYVKAGGDLSQLNSPLSWNQSGPSNPYFLALVDLKRLKDENIFFVLLRLFYVFLGIDAIVRQSVIQLVAHTALELMSVVFAATQLYETHVCKSLVQSDMDTGVFDSAIHLSIAVIVICSVFTLVLAYLCKILQQEIGWNTYKRLGADQDQKKRFRLAQLFLLVLKLDAFFHLVFSVFFLVVMTQEYIFARGPAFVVWYIFHLVVTLLQIPCFLIARRGVTKEKPGAMNLYMGLQFIFIVDFFIILQQTATSWAYWALAVCLAILLCIVTVVLTIYAKRNFNMGLLIHMQHLMDDENILKNEHKLGTTSERNSWLIDDDIEHDFTSAPPPPSKTITPHPPTNMEDSNKILLESNNNQHY